MQYSTIVHKFPEIDCQIRRAIPARNIDSTEPCTLSWFAQLGDMCKTEPIFSSLNAHSPGSSSRPSYYADSESAVDTNMRLLCLAQLEHLRCSVAHSYEDWSSWRGRVWPWHFSLLSFQLLVIFVSALTWDDNLDSPTGWALACSLLRREQVQ